MGNVPSSPNVETREDTFFTNAQRIPSPRKSASIKDNIKKLELRFLELEENNVLNPDTSDCLNTLYKAVTKAMCGWTSDIDEIVKRDGVSLFVRFLKHLSKNSTSYPQNGLELECYSTLQNLCVNACDNSANFCDECRKKGLLKLMVSDLETLKNKFKTDLTTYGDFALHAMNVLYNSVISKNNIEYLKGLRIASLVRWYADNTHDLEIKGEKCFPVLSSVLLTYLVEEVDFEVEDDVVEFLFEHLKSAATSATSDFEGFSIEELATGLAKLSANISNSRAIGRKKGIFEMIENLLQNEKTNSTATELMNNMLKSNEIKSKFLNHPIIITLLQNIWKQGNENLQIKVGKTLSSLQSSEQDTVVDKSDQVKRSVKTAVQNLKQDLIEVQNGNSPDAQVMQKIVDLDCEVLASERNEQTFSENVADQLAYVGVAKIMLDYMKALTQDNNRYEEDEFLWKCYEVVRSLCWNASDRSLLFCEESGKCGMLSFLAEELQFLQPKLAKASAELGRLAMEAMSIIQNCAKEPNNIPVLEKLDIVSLVKWYSENKHFIENTSFPTVCNVVLAYIADEDQIDEILANTHVVPYMMQNLGIALSMESHSYEGFSAAELAAGLRKLAKNRENNLNIMEESKDHEIFTPMLQKGSANEKLLAVELLCQLAFTNENKLAICRDETITEFLRTSAVDNSDIQLQSMSKLALFVLMEGKLYSSTEERNEKSPLDKSMSQLFIRLKSLHKNENLVAISYQQDDHNLILQIKERLESSNFQVRLDVDRIGSNFLDPAAIHDIEQASTVFICISRKYKDSLYCRAVAEYAYRCGGNYFIPLLVEDESCRPNGWLNFILEKNKKCFNVSNGYSRQMHQTIMEHFKKPISLCTDDNYSSDEESEISEWSSDSSNASSENSMKQTPSSSQSLQKKQTMHSRASEVSTVATLQKASASRTSNQSSSSKHIMISYQHDYQPLIKQITNDLEHSGYKVCVDFKNMGANLMDFMQKGIEGSAVMLLCMSKGYEKSDNTRDEAEYARKVLARDDIIPLLVEKGYKPNGWLDFLIGAKFFHDVTDGYTTEAHQKLVRQIGRRGKKEHD